MPRSSDVSGLPMSLFVTITCLASAGTVYSAAFIVFNVVLRKHKLVKLTSPNINIVILIGTMLGYAAIVVGGLDTSRSSVPIQACLFMATFAFTLIYGSLFTKVCRIHMIFNNISFSGKTCRDEILILAITALLALDCVILLPWQITDPLTCISSSATPTVPEFEVNTTWTQQPSLQAQTCKSSLQVVWISSLYVYKALLLAVGLYLTWQIRQVKLPALRDTVQLAATLLTVTTLSITVLPALLTVSNNHDSITIRYAVCSVGALVTLFTTASLLFIPKVVLSSQYNDKQPDNDRLRFSEYMTAKDSKDSCCGCLRSDGNQGDYAMQILATEIYTLERTVREKDVTIRELTDRLYIGAEQFHRYLTSTSRSPSTSRRNGVIVEQRSPVFDDVSDDDDVSVSLEYGRLADTSTRVSRPIDASRYNHVTSIAVGQTCQGHITNTTRPTSLLNKFAVYQI